MSGNPEQEILGAGITEEIISDLSLIPHLFVIARRSVFAYKGKQVGIQQIRRELGVRYVMEGSFERSDDHLRITARLVDALTGHQLWAERYDRKLKEVFALQDEITLEILRALEVKLTEGQQAGAGHCSYQAGHSKQSHRARPVLLFSGASLSILRTIRRGDRRV